MRIRSILACGVLGVAILAATTYFGCMQKDASYRYSGYTQKEPPATYFDAPMPEVRSSVSGRVSYMGGGASYSRVGAASMSDTAPPGSLPSDDEELWVIQRYTPERNPAGDAEEMPGSGTLKTRVNDKEVALPLKHTDVKAQISGYIGTVRVTQKYENPYDGKIEAVYVFPLPHNAAVNEFVMTVGERKIRGIIRDRQEAEQIYQQAREQGYVASLLTQERPNIFTQKVANIEPGKAIDIDIKYFHTLAYHDGYYEFVFPMVVGPRFNPPDSTEGVGAVGRGNPGASRQKTEVQYLNPGERSGHDIALSVAIDAGVSIEQIKSPSHVISVTQPAPARAEVTLSAFDRIPNKDFVLRYKVASDQIKSAMLTDRDERGGFFTLMLYPPAELTGLKRKPLELVFVIDCSGSMSGQPIAQCKSAISWALRRMQPDDSFQVIRFSNNASQLGRQPLSATPANVSRALNYVQQLEDGGGTMAIEGVKAALDFPHDPSRLRFVCFLTDGFIGNEPEIIRETQRRLGASRVFSFGVGSSPNRYLLEGLAKVGRGAVAYLGLHDSGDKVMDAFFERISHPAMTDLAIDWGGMQVTDVYPQVVPDLFVGRPVVLTGRFKGEGSATVCVRGQIVGERKTLMLRAELDGEDAHHAGVPMIWARTKIAHLSDWSTADDPSQMANQVKSLALEYGLMSAYTAFVAVDSLTQTKGDHGTTVAVPVPVPEGVRYETTVESK